MTTPRPISVSWLGHATVLLDVGGTRIITDPALTVRLAHLRRRQPVVLPGTADVVALSHLHMDHLHRPSLRHVTGEQTRILMPAGARPLLRSLRFGEADELRPGDSVEVDGEVTAGAGRLRIEAVHAEHSPRRGPHSRRVAPALGYVVRTGGRTVYFAGDTGPFDAMADLGPVDVALLPIWGWGPSLGERHLDPTSAADAARLLRAERVIPIHWGTYSPVRARPGAPPWLNDPLGAFRHALEERGLGERLIPLRPGDEATLAG
jgi:L-ascorbate metabolism protein UlaG (beta-lactamase superfamily)